MKPLSCQYWPPNFFHRRQVGANTQFEKRWSRLFIHGFVLNLDQSQFDNIDFLSVEEGYVQTINLTCHQQLPLIVFQVLRARSKPLNLQDQSQKPVQQCLSGLNDSVQMFYKIKVIILVRGVFLGGAYKLS